MILFKEFSLIDGIAVILFFLAWVSHYYITNYSVWRVHTITHHMLGEREKWMRNAMVRQGSPFDALIQNALQQGVLFFGSTSILLIGALIAGLGASDRALSILQDFPISSTQTSTQWEVKLLFILFIFVFAFFKFAWSYRLFNYVIIMIGAATLPAKNDEEAEKQAHKLAQLHALGARHFTTGINAYLFATAGFAWFINAWCLIAATVWVSIVLYRRAFASKFSKIYASS